MSKNGDKLALYYHPYSFNSQKVVMALHQMKIKHVLKLVDIHKGRQFSDYFLSLNPRAEVPVLVDDTRVIPDSEKIIEYLEDNFTNGNGLVPSDKEIRTRMEQLHETIYSLKIEAITFGAAMYDDLGINPKYPYNCMTNRSQMKEYLERRPGILQNEANRFPKYADSLKAKLSEVYEDSKLWQNRDNYEGLLILFEKVMDECEAELTSHENPSWWLCSPDISVADVDFGLLLYRLWQLGFERRLWERNRPNVKRYFSRIQMLESFQQAVTMTEGLPMLEFFTSPVVLGLLGTSIVLVGGYYLWKEKGTEISEALNTFFANNPQQSQHPFAPSQPPRITAFTTRPTTARPGQFI